MSPLISVQNSKIAEYTLLVNISLVFILLGKDRHSTRRHLHSNSANHRNKLRNNTHIHLELHPEVYNKSRYSNRYMYCCRDIQQFLSSGHPVELKDGKRVLCCLSTFLSHGNQVYELDRKNIQDIEEWVEEWCKLGAASSFMKGSGSEWTKLIEVNLESRTRT